MRACTYTPLQFTQLGREVLSVSRRVWLTTRTPAAPRSMLQVYYRNRTSSKNTLQSVWLRGSRYSESPSSSAILCVSHFPSNKASQGVISFLSILGEGFRATPHAVYNPRQMYSIYREKNGLLLPGAVGEIAQAVITVKATGMAQLTWPSIKLFMQVW